MIGLYATLLAVVMLGFDAYTYKRLQHFLRGVLGSTLEHRAEQIAEGILQEIPAKGRRLRRPGH